MRKVKGSGERCCGPASGRITLLSPFDRWSSLLDESRVPRAEASRPASFAPIRKPEMYKAVEATPGSISFLTRSRRSSNVKIGTRGQMISAAGAILLGSALNRMPRSRFQSVSPSGYIPGIDY